MKNVVLFSLMFLVFTVSFRVLAEKIQCSGDTSGGNDAYLIIETAPQGSKKSFDYTFTISDSDGEYGSFEYFFQSNSNIKSSIIQHRNQDWSIKIFAKKQNVISVELSARDYYGVTLTRSTLVCAQK